MIRTANSGEQRRIRNERGERFSHEKVIDPPAEVFLPRLRTERPPRILSGHVAVNMPERIDESKFCKRVHPLPLRKQESGKLALLCNLGVMDIDRFVTDIKVAAYYHSAAIFGRQFL